MQHKYTPPGGRGPVGVVLADPLLRAPELFLSGLDELLGRSEEGPDAADDG